MGQRGKILLRATLVGAAIGASATKLLDIRRLAAIPFFSPDRALIGYRAFLAASLAGWVLFSLYWEIAARNAAAAKSSESRASRGVHVILANAALLLEIAPIRGLGRFVPVWLPIMAAGLALEAMGLLLAIWARRHLGRNWSGEISIKVSHQLIRSGPYRLLRHPIYTGLLAMYAGVALVTGEWLAAVGLALAAFAYWRKIRLEAANLDRAFGGDYDAYRRSTWSLVPGIF
jgi:protein-S-isoprenylcysteine O-methyltransferase Ste14